MVTVLEIAKYTNKNVFTGICLLKKNLKRYQGTLLLTCWNWVVPGECGYKEVSSGGEESWSSGASCSSGSCRWRGIKEKKKKDFIFIFKMKKQTKTKHWQWMYQKCPSIFQQGSGCRSKSSLFQSDMVAWESQRSNCVYSSDVWEDSTSESCCLDFLWLCYYRTK